MEQNEEVKQQTPWEVVKHVAKHLVINPEGVAAVLEAVKNGWKADHDQMLQRVNATVRENRAKTLKELRESIEKEREDTNMEDELEREANEENPEFENYQCR